MVILCSILLISCSNSDSKEAAFNPRIINGDIAEQANLPQYVKVASSATGLIGSFAGCTGTVIGLSGRAVLTAAHCISGARYVAIQTGDQNGPIYWANEVYTAPGYIAPEFGGFNDLAIVITPESVQRPALPLLASTMVPQGENLMVIGFGVENASDGSFGILRVGNIRADIVTSDFIVSSFSANESSVCYGDSGGPLIYIIKDEFGNPLVPSLAGITSAGTSRSCNGGLEYFTNISPLLPFILQIVPDASLV